MNGKIKPDARFFEEQLFEAKQALFSATTIRQVKFLQERIKYLNEKVKSNGRAWRA